MKSSSVGLKVTRRFLAAAGAAIAAPMFIPGSALGADGRPAPSERITMGIVGWGMMGPGNTQAFLGQTDCQVLAACDLDQKHLQQAVDTVNRHYGNSDCKPFHDYRELMDWIGHPGDIAHWGLGFDNSGPVEVEGQGEFPPEDAIWNTCTKYRIQLRYPTDIDMVIAGGNPDNRSGTKWIGQDGWVWVDRGGFEASNPEWREIKQLPDDQRKVRLYQSPNHHRNFLDAVKSRKPTITPVETVHHSAIPGHLGLISMRVGRRLNWDAKKELIVGDEEARRLLTRPYRMPWTLS